MEKRIKTKLKLFIVFFVLLYISIVVLAFIKISELNHEPIVTPKEEKKDLVINKLEYTQFLLEEGSIKGTPILVENDELKINDIIITNNFNNVKLYKFDDLNLLYYEIEKEIYLVLFDKDNNIKLTNQEILNEYHNYYISGFFIGDNGITIRLNNKKEKCNSIKEVSLFYEYLERNRLSDGVLIGSKNKKCVEGV